VKRLDYKGFRCVAHRTLTASAAAILAVGCNLVPGLANMTATSADNPLGGGPALTWSKQPAEVPFDGKKACSVWPIENSMTVQATEEKLCAEATMYTLANDAFDGSESTLDFSSNGSLDTNIGDDPAKERLRAQPQKIGHCYNDSTKAERSVWVSKFSGCVANVDDNGRPILTKKSTYLQVGDARWRFPTPASPAAAPAPAASTQAGGTAAAAK
jgi:hypothetical protein